MSEGDPARSTNVASPPGDYPGDYYEALEEGARRSAIEIVPMILDLVRPAHVVDVGCGTGAWLSVFREHGIEDLLGIDGSWVDPERLLFPIERFLAADLEKPVRVDRRFDLVLSLEVAEHLAPEYADTFIDSLTRLGGVVLFSAAMPFQGGTNHVNEQWISYWTTLFASRGYLAVDCLRTRVWENEQVDWWYAQNLVFFVHEDHLGAHPALAAERERCGAPPLSIVHPGSLMKRRRQISEMEDVEAGLCDVIERLERELRRLRSGCE